MILETIKSFEKDIEKIKDKKLAAQLHKLIEELETVNSLSEVNNIKKMNAKGHYYRVRIGDYRLGLKLGKETITLLRFMHRKDIYKYFP